MIARSNWSSGRKKRRQRWSCRRRYPIKCMLRRRAEGARSSSPVLPRLEGRAATRIDRRRETSASHRRAKMIDEAQSKAKVKNPAAVLLDEDGVFELTSPWGDVFRVTCQRGVGMAFTRVGEVGRRTRCSTTWR